MTKFSVNMKKRNELLANTLIKGLKSRNIQIYEAKVHMELESRSETKKNWGMV